MATWFPLPPGARLMIESSHEGGVYGLVSITGDGDQIRLVSGGGEGRLYLRDENGALLAPAIALPAGSGVLDLAAAPTGDAVLAGTMAGAMVVDLDRRTVQPVVGPTRWIRSVAWTSAGCVAGGDDNQLWYWSAEQPPRALARGRGSLRQVALVEVDGAPCALALDAFRGLSVRPIADPGRRLWQRDDFEDGQASVIAAAGPAIAVAGDQGPIRLLDPATGATRRELPSPDGVTAMTWTDEGLVTGHRDLVLRRWSAENGRCLAEQPSGHTSWIRAIVAVAGGYLTGDDSGDLHTPHGTVARAESGPIAIAWSPARDQLLSSDGKSVAAWNVDTGEVAERWPVARAVAIAASASDLYFAELGGRIVRYSLESGEVAAEVRVKLAVSRLALADQSVFAIDDAGRAVTLDPTTLRGHGGAVPAPEPALRRDSDLYAWERHGSTWRAAFVGGSLVLEHAGRALVPPGARARVKLWMGPAAMPLPL